MPARGDEKMGFVQRQLYHWNLWTGLYMLDWWERLIFNLVFFAFTIGSAYSVYYHGAQAAQYATRELPGITYDLWLRSIGAK